MSKQLSTKSLTQGAIMAALSATLIFLSQIIPLFGVVLAVVSAVPITVLAVREGATVGSIGAIVTSLILIMLLGPLAGLMLALQTVSVGLIIGIMLHKRRGAVKIIAAAILVAILSKVLVLLAVLAISGLVLPDVNQLVQQGMDMYRQFGMLESLANQGYSEVEVQLMLQSMTTVVLSFLPGILVAASAVGALINYWVTIALLKRIKIRVPRLPSFTSWHLPTNWVWGLIAAWIIWLGADYIQLEWLAILGKNIMLLYAIILIINGLAVVAHYIGFKKMGTGMKVMTVFFIFFFFSGTMMVALLTGLTDIVLDLRKIKSKK